MVFKLGEFFCGPGGLALGAHHASIEAFSIESVWANDYDRDTCETYFQNISNFHPVKVHCKDVRKLDINKLGAIDAFAFGFPCNDYSVVGEQKGMDGVFGPLYSYGVKVIKKYRPKWFLAENVSGLKNANDGKAFETILTDMHKEGYDLYPNLYKFENYGVPQARHRLIIIGIRSDLNVCFRVPAPTHSIPVTCQQAIEEPPISIDAKNNELTKQSVDVVSRLKYIKPGQNAFTASIPKKLQLNIRGARISQIYKRLDPDKPAYTITGSGGGGTHVYHWKEDRALTNRERARLQTFPDDFYFCGSKESVRKQIGMAVPPRGAQIIFNAILKSFAGISYPHIACSIKPKFHDFSKELAYVNEFSKQLRVMEPEVEYA
jgi:DNA (cytosine-5)-methyltransferase 1